MKPRRTNLPPEDLDRFLDTEESNSVRKGTALRFLQAALRYPRLLCASCAIMIIGTAAALIEPRLFGYAIDDAIVPKNWPRLQQLTLIFLSLSIIRVLAMIAEGYLFESLGQAVTQDLRMAVFSRLQRLPLVLFDKHPAGRLMTRVTNDISALTEVFSGGIVLLVSNALLVAGVLIWLLILDLRLGLITLSVFPLMLYAAIRFSQQLQIAYREARSRLSALNGFLAENLMGIRVVHLFNREEVHARRFARLNQWYADAQTASIRTYAFLQPATTVAGGISIALVIWFGGNQALTGGLPLGVLVTFFAFALTLFRPLREMADKWNIFLAGLAAAERIFSVLEWPVELPEPDTQAPSAEPLELKGEIVFENVWFAYQEERWVLRNFSLTIPAGSRLGIVGHTGSGKTTLINLLMRFYEPQRGRILLDGKDLREYDKRQLRARLGLVQQDLFLFAGSLTDNVTRFSTEAGVNAEALLVEVRVTPTRILAERASNLSAGERQLVAFARTRAANPSIWILDEATSNMDSTSERVIDRAIRRTAQGKTLIVIAHRLATMRMCDQIIVLNKGQLVEAGDHETLLERDGLYARLFRYLQVAEMAGARASEAG